MEAAQPISLAAGALQVGSGVFRGATVRETAGAAATVKLFDNASAGSGKLLMTIALTANTSLTPWDNNTGLWFQNGVFAVITGTVEGSIFLG